jgi:hypothetical protein
MTGKVTNVTVCKNHLLNSHFKTESFEKFNINFFHFVFLR